MLAVCLNKINKNCDKKKVIFQWEDNKVSQERSKEISDKISAMRRMYKGHVESVDTSEELTRKASLIGSVPGARTRRGN